MNPKCKECNSCLEPIYFGPKRYLYCDFCMVWYDGITPNLFVVPREEAMKVFDEWKKSITSISESEGKNNG